MAYGGESNAKKLARFEFWLHIWTVRWDETSPRFTDRVLVLAGPEAADIRILTALGVPPENITAVDIDPEALESSRAREPEANYVLGDVFEHLKGEGRKRYDVIFLDFCQAVSPQLVQKFVQGTRAGMRSRTGILGLGAMYGREPKEFKGWTRNVDIDPKRARQSNSEETGDMSMAARLRANFLWQAFERMLTGTRMLHSPVAVITYRSGKRASPTKRSNGVPMIYMAFIVQRLKRFQGKQAWAEALMRYGSDVGAIAMLKDIGDDPDGELLKAEALDLRKTKNFESRHVAALLNIKRQQVAAWLAWETMRAQEKGEETCR